MVLVQVLPSSPLFSDKATGRMRNMPTLRASFSWARLTASLSHANAQMAIHNASSVPIKMRETPSNLRIEAKSFYGYKIPVGQLSACHSALSSPPAGGCNYYLWLVRFSTLGNEKRRPLVDHK